MPSEELDRRLFGVLARPLGAFRSAVAGALEQIRGTRDAQRVSRGGDRDAAAAALGGFATGRIDVERFTSLLSRADLLEAAALERVERAYDVLSSIADAGDDLFRVVVEPGADLAGDVGARLADIGRAFGAARVFELSRGGRYRDAEHGTLLDTFGFERWNRAERAIAPPLLVHVDGHDLHADGLARFLDGATRLLLVVRGDAPFAPLVRLVTPGTFVVQAASEEALPRFAASDGPGIAALLQGNAAHFAHDPAGGAHVWERITVECVPEDAPPPRLGGRSAAQQAEELAQLAVLATPPPAPVAAPVAAAAVGTARAGAAADDPVDRLAAWLLAQADLKGLT